MTLGFPRYALDARLPQRRARLFMLVDRHGAASTRCRSMLEARSRRSHHHALTTLLLGLASLATLSTPAAAQDLRNQFGRQDRADAASRALVLAVQQGISSLPPTAGQSFVYEFDPSVDTFTRSEALGPVSFRTPQTVGRKKLILRLATSYFSLSEELGPIDYRFDFGSAMFEPRFAKLGTELKANVRLLNLSLNYGLFSRVELRGNLPIVIIDAQGEQIFSSPPDQPSDTRSMPACRSHSCEPLSTVV